jgi:hypothetical protein
VARIRRGEFRRKKSQHALHTNFRLQKIGAKPTRKEVENVFERILDTHRIPKGWKLAAIEWSHTKDGSRGWHEGSMRDLGQFDQVMEYLLEKMRIGVVRGKSKGDVWEIEIAMEY